MLTHIIERVTRLQVYTIVIKYMQLLCVICPKKEFLQIAKHYEYMTKSISVLLARYMYSV